MTDGFLNILKPPGMTSHDVIGFVRKVLNIKKVGHAGTLDPGAAGVLPVAVGRAVRLIEYLAAVDKSYRAEVLLGIATDSGDDTGRTIQEQKNFVMPSIDRLHAAMRQLTGTIVQVPPAYSAIKINGKRACDLVRQHIDVEIPGREVTIYRMELLERRVNNILIDVECTKGTYIRTLCADLGEKLGIPATMAFLVRTRVGEFRLEDACTLEELAELQEQALLRPDAFLAHIPAYTIAEERIMAFRNGLSTHDRDANFAQGLVRVYGSCGFIGIGNFDPATQSIAPQKVFLSNRVQ